MSKNGALPSGWAFARLGEIAEIQGGIQKQPKRAPGTNSYPFLRVANVLRGSLDLADVHRIELFGGELERLRLRTGDLLIVEGNGSRSEIGRMSIWNGAVADCVHQNHIIRARLNPALLPRFVELYWNSPAGSEQIMTLSSSTSGLYTLSVSKVGTIDVPIAPLSEQHRIIGEVDAHLTRIDAGVQAFVRLQANLKQYRASVLKAACEGKLVPTEAALAKAEEREYEPADKLLARILEGRRERWEVEQLARMKAKGKESKDDVWKKRYEEPLALDAMDRPTLPPGWLWTTLGALSWDSGYGTSEKCSYEAAGPPVLRIPNITAGRIDLSDLKFALREGNVHDADAVSPGDLLIVRTNGSKDLIGRAGLVRRHESHSHFFASYLIRFRLVKVEEWISMIWSAPQVRARVMSTAATSAGQYNVSQRNLAAVELPLPPEQEIARILAEVDRRTSVIEELETAIDRNLKRAERLRQAVLKRAFEGKLVPQDPADEPAAVLLERIRAERAAEAGRAGSGRKRGGGRGKLSREEEQADG